MQLQIQAIPAFDDNYIWVIHNDTHCVVVDPGQADGVLNFVRDHQLTIAAILVTHHHYDHCGGVNELNAASPCVVYGPDNPKIEGITHACREGDSVQINALNLEFKVIECPGHTLDHIAFYAQPWLFCGDTLFSAGCGRMFEGSPSQFMQSLTKLAALPEDTQIYCGHEYTQANLTFAAAVEPDNQAIRDYQQRVAALRKQGLPSLPNVLTTELAINPFLRCAKQSVKDSAQTRAQTSLNDINDVFACIRYWKDNF